MTPPSSIPARNSLGYKWDDSMGEVGRMEGVKEVRVRHLRREKVGCFVPLKDYSNRMRTAVLSDGIDKRVAGM